MDKNKKRYLTTHYNFISKVMSITAEAFSSAFRIAWLYMVSVSFLFILCVSKKRQGRPQNEKNEIMGNKNVNYLPK